MLEIGSRVTGVVTRIEVFGMFLQTGDIEIFVPLGNMSWSTDVNPAKQYSVGDTLEVKILRFNKDKGLYTGSVKHLKPEENPYGVLAKNTTYYGSVGLVHQNGFTVMLPNGCVGEVYDSDKKYSVREGDPVIVKVETLDLDDERLVLVLAK